MERFIFWRPCRDSLRVPLPGGDQIQELGGRHTRRRRSRISSPAKNCAMVSQICDHAKLPCTPTRQAHPWVFDLTPQDLERRGVLRSLKRSERFSARFENDESPNGMRSIGAKTMSH